MIATRLSDSIHLYVDAMSIYGHGVNQNTPVEIRLIRLARTVLLKSYSAF
jgi:hypothetical protein